ncbi:MAG TPA: hypothetical protein VLC97_09490 [Rhodanobacteraceae bacterium]|nr:hypothetical protein [Rhodanobacteraceae bacterium]
MAASGSEESGLFQRVWRKFADSFADHAAAWLVATIGAAVLLVLGIAKGYLLGLAGPIDHALAMIGYRSWAYAVVVILALCLFFEWRWRVLRKRLKIWQPGESDFQPYGGVLWKVFPRDGYVEESPYCTCCDPPRVLGSTEIADRFAPLRCPIQATELNIVVDGFARPVRDTWDAISKAWFHEVLERELTTTYFRLKELHPDDDETALLKRVFGEEPQNRIPKRLLRPVFRRYKTAFEIFKFIGQNPRQYWRYLIAKK